MTFTQLFDMQLIRLICTLMFVTLMLDVLIHRGPKFDSQKLKVQKSKKHD